MCRKEGKRETSANYFNALLPRRQKFTTPLCFFFTILLKRRTNKERDRSYYWLDRLTSTIKMDFHSLPLLQATIFVKCVRVLKACHV